MTLIEAIQQNNEKAFFELLSSPLPANTLEKKIIDEVDAECVGNGLYWAATCGYLHFIGPLIKAGVSVNKRNNLGWTPVYGAAHFGYAEIITVLRAGGADVNTPDDSGTTPVCAATYGGHAKAITVLKAVGADVNATEVNGLTPLYIAVQKGDIEVISALLEAGANVSTRTPHGAPLELARKFGYLEIVSLLESHLQQYPNCIKTLFVNSEAILLDQESHPEEFAKEVNQCRNSTVESKVSKDIRTPLISDELENAINLPSQAEIQVYAKEQGILLIIPNTPKLGVTYVYERKKVQKHLETKVENEGTPEDKRTFSSSAGAAFNLPVSPVSPATPALRRGSGKLNLTDVKEEQEIPYVLEHLRTFFLEERDSGKKTENYFIYNEYLKKANSSAKLVYKTKKNKHLLYVDNQPVDSRTAAENIFKTIESLTVENVRKKPMVLATPQLAVNNISQTNTVQEALKPNPPEKKPTGSAILDQATEVGKPASKVNARVISDLATLLRPNNLLQTFFQVDVNDSKKTISVTETIKKNTCLSSFSQFKKPSWNTLQLQEIERKRQRLSGLKSNYLPKSSPLPKLANPQQCQSIEQQRASDCEKSKRFQFANTQQLRLKCKSLNKI